jgi:hypothetical protein
MWQFLAGAGLQGIGSLLGARKAAKAARAAANIQAGQAQENAAQARAMPYELNPYEQKSAEQWSGNVRNVYDEAGNLVMDTAQGAAAGARGAAQTANTYLDPYLQQGQGANTTLADWATQKLTGPQAQFEFSQNDPSYKWRLAQGEQALQRSAAARGALTGGGTMKALTRYAQGAASQEYGAEHARWLAEQDLANRGQALGATTLSGLAQRGLEAGTGMGRNLLAGEELAGNWMTQGARTAGDFRGRGAEYQSNMMNNSTLNQLNRIYEGEALGRGYMTDRATALAGGEVGAANAWNQGLQGAFGAAGQGLTLSGLMGAKPPMAAWPNQGRIPGLPPQYSIPGSPSYWR